ncbi:MAG: HAD family hydrolase [Patescibacteria group bacterium]
MSKRVGAVLYDWDGVVQDTMPAIHAASCIVFETVGLTPPCLRYFCRTLRAPFEDWFREHGVVTITEEERHRIYQAALQKDDSPLLLGAHETLVALKGLGLKQGIVSGSSVENLWRMFEKHGLSKYLDLFFGGSENKVQPLSRACKILGFKSYQVLYVGDLASDIRDGKQAGLKTVAFIGQYGSPSSFSEVEPDYLVKSHHDLQTLISSLAK